jgi:hypothetical protein
MGIMIIMKKIGRLRILGLILTMFSVLSLATPAAPAEPRFMAVASVWGVWRAAGPFAKSDCEQFNTVMREAVRLRLAQMDPPLSLFVVVPGLYAGGEEGLFIIQCVEIVNKVDLGGAKP